MSSSTHRFVLPTHRKSIIKVIGVGGGGSNAIDNMYKRGIQDVDFVICNTDAQALKNSTIETKLQIGINLTSGLGAGANPEVGKNAAIESKEEIKSLLSDGTKMLFITAGMGGGTGTGAAPVIASIARKLDILTVGIVTLPFSFEGKKKLLQAQSGIEELRQHCDTVLIILNDRLRAVLGNLSIGNAFAQADNVLTTAAKSIAEIITVPGYVNVDFEDVKTVMKRAGAAVMGSGQAEGEGRALKAAKLALTSPLLDYRDIHGAKKILLSIVSGQDAEMQMDELTEITDYIQEQVGDDAEMIFGHGSDEQLKEGIRVTVIATGFNKEEKSTAPTEKSTASAKIVKPNNELKKEQQGQLFQDLKQEESAINNPQNEGKSPYYSNKNAHSNDQKPLTNPYKPESTLSPSSSDSSLEQRKEHFYRRYQERMTERSSQQGSKMSEDLFKQYSEVPAYLRKGIVLEPITPNLAKEIVHHQLQLQEENKPQEQENQLNLEDNITI
jgi:cell division protein FtsZ